MSDGFFMRAESFFDFATCLDGASDLMAYGGKSLHAQSHGESFLALFDNRFEQSLCILEEPEAALLPQRQLSFLKIIHDLETPGHARFIIASHSPILLAYPGATRYSLSTDGISEIAYRETEHYLVAKGFLNTPERYLKYLFAGEDQDEGDS
jgi:predicted ATPase